VNLRQVNFRLANSKQMNLRGVISFSPAPDLFVLGRWLAKSSFHV
jgi:hypothetical protein